MKDSYILVTGGAGFIGTNLADSLLRSGERVCVLDNLSRAGVEENLRWLRAEHKDALEVVIADVRDRAAVERAVARAKAVFHLAAQVAVTTSLDRPLDDFHVNVRGTLNVLEAVREHDRAVPVVFTSTNKVYGALDDVPLVETPTRHEPANPFLARSGIGESRALDFHSPYGCPKGAADQYVLDWARTFGLRTVVFRMSCIYGPHQLGTEDQGWVAHFAIRALEGKPVTIYGDGKQVRDILFVDDLVAAFRLVLANAEQLSGEAFNVGGGPANTTSLLELVALLGELRGAAPRFTLEPWRLADQKYYVSDTGKLEAVTGWRAAVGVRAGVERLCEWLARARGIETRRLAA